MQYVPFGNTTMEVSRLCLGGMMFSRTMDADATRLVIDEALAHGVNFIDTAESYTDSEDLIGRALQGRRDKVYLATKVYTKRAREGRAARNSRANILFSLDRSLELLRTDFVDLYQLHHPDPETPLDETLATLEAIVKQGKARHVGVSNHYAWQMAYMIGVARERHVPPIVSIQCRYNLLDRVAEVETFPMAQRFNLAVMTYAPLCGGILTGKYHRGETAAPGTRSASDAKVQKLLSQDATFDVVEKLKSIANEQGVALNQLGWLWLLSKAQVTTPILGGSKPEHFRPLYAIVDRRLPPDVMQQLDEITSAYIHRPWHNQPETSGPPV